MASDRGFALAFFPTIAIGGRRGPFQLAFVAFMTDACAFGATAKAIGQTTSSAFKDVLVNVFSTRPGETASVIAANDMQGRVIRGAAIGINHRNQSFLLRFQIIRAFFGYFLRGLE